jgi:hypothetical protein
MSELDFSLIMAEIFEEYTELQTSFGAVYFKHFSFVETKKISATKAFYLNQAIKKGLSLEVDILKQLKQDNIWPEEDEAFIKSKRAFIENLRKSLPKIQIPSQRENHRKLIDMEESKLIKKEDERKVLIGITAESYAEQRANQDFMNSFIFIDREMTKPLADNIDGNEDDYILDLNAAQKKFFERFSDSNISKLALSDDFSPLLFHTKTPQTIFGKSIKEMTAFQIKLCSYGRSFLTIFENCAKDIPPSVAKNPDLLIEFYEAQKNDSKRPNKNKNGDGATTYFGANKEDIDILADKDDKKIELSEEIKKRGGKLDMEEMMKLHGI